jgi:hypothetical protein
VIIVTIIFEQHSMVVDNLTSKFKSFKKHLIEKLQIPCTHNILRPTRGVTLFNSGFKSDSTKLFPPKLPVTVG